MTFCNDFRRAAVLAALLSGCSFAQSTAGSPIQQVQGPARATVSTCGESAAGHAQCLAVVRAGARGSTKPVGWTPRDLQSAYNLPSSKKGRGQIVAVVDAYDNPNTAGDLGHYRATFRLPSADFVKYNQEGQQYDYPQGSPTWGLEIDYDVEMVSASCPNCTIYLVEAKSDGVSDMEAAEAEAVTLGAHIVTNSYSGTAFDRSYFDAHGVTYLASPSGTSGLSEPADFDSVAAAGGTLLERQVSGKRKWSEIVPSDANEGGCFRGVGKAPWQHQGRCKYRLANDVAADAYDLAAYDSYDYSGWLELNNSPTAPFLAGVFGLAGNATKQRGGRTFWLAAHQKYLYPVREGTRNCAYSSGNYNTCTGWGSPDGIGAF